MKTTITFHADAVILPPLILEVVYSYDPGEPMVMYFPDGSGYPGSPAGVEIESVRCIDIDMDWNPDFAFRPGAGKVIGSLAYSADPKQIERLVMEAYWEDNREYERDE